MNRLTRCLSIAVVGSALFALAAGNDPTKLSASMGNVLKAQLAEFRALEIRGLVSAANSGGVAIVQAKGDETLRVARKGTTLPLSAGGVPFPVKVTDVTDNGVEVAAETLDAKWTIPVSFAREGRAAANCTTGNLAYVEFEGLTLKTALRLLSDQSGRNFVWTEQSANVAVSLFLRDATVDKVVDELCKSHKLWYRKDETTGITRIVTMEEFKESLTGYQQEEIIETFTLLYPNVTEVASIIQGVYADRVQLSLGDEDILDDELSDLSRRFEKFQAINNSSSSSDLMDGFNSVNTISSVGYGRRGGGIYSTSGGMMARSGQVRQAAEIRRNEQQLERFSAEDAAKLQNILNAKASNDVVAAALKDNRYQPPSVYVTVSRRSNILVVRTGDPRIMDEIRRLITKVDVPTPMVLLEVEIMELSLDDGLSSVFDLELDDIAKGRTWIGGETDFNPSIPGTITFSILSEHISSRIKAERQRGKVKTLATPTLLTAHNEVSQLFIGREIPIVKNITATTVVNKEGTSVVVPQTETEWKKEGVRLLITPNINADRTVTLRMTQENSSKREDQDCQIAVVNTVDGSVESYKVDTIDVRSISGTFVAKDNMAIVAGGLIKEQMQDVQSGIPLLMDLPWLGWFFRATTREKTRSELVVYLKPHVLSTPGETRRVSAAFTDDKVRNPYADKYRSAKGMEKEKQDRAEAEADQKKIEILPDVDTFHIKLQ